MPRKHIPLIAQHESWISLDPIQGCPASCVYCYLEPPGLTRQVPQQPLEAPEEIYQQLPIYRYFDKSLFSRAVDGRPPPIAIGNYTDMCLVPKNRQFLLSLLHKHKEHLPDVPVCIVTKASLSQAFLEEVQKIGITVLFFISLSFLASSLEKGTPPIENRLANFERISHFSNLYAIHFWRPVTSLTVPDRASAKRQIETLAKAGAPVSVITGLKFGDNLAKIFRSQEQHALHAFFKDQVQHDHLKNEIFEPEVQETLLSVAQELSYPMYLHTSCAVSYILKQADYNATFRKPHFEARCLASTCPSAQRERCFSLKARVPIPSQTLLERVAQYLNLPVSSITYSERRETIFVNRELTQEEQTFLTQATGFSVRGQGLVPTLEWIGSINR